MHLTKSKLCLNVETSSLQQLSPKSVLSSPEPCAPVRLPVKWAPVDLLWIQLSSLHGWHALPLTSPKPAFLVWPYVAFWLQNSSIWAPCRHGRNRIVHFLCGSFSLYSSLWPSFLRGALKKGYPSPHSGFLRWLHICLLMSLSTAPWWLNGHQIPPPGILGCSLISLLICTSHVEPFRKTPFLGQLCALQLPWCQEHSLYVLCYVRAMSPQGFWAWPVASVTRQL